MSSTTHKKYYHTDSIQPSADRLYQIEHRLRNKILDYYSVCMPVEYELFSYMKTLIKKNKFNSIDIDVFDMNVGKYIKKQQYPNEVMEEFYEFLPRNSYPPIDNIWFYNMDDVQIFHMDRIKESFPELSKANIRICNITPEDIDIIEPYLKSKEYKEDRREMIIQKKEEVDILKLEEKYKDNKIQLNNILQNTINLYLTIKTFGREASVNETLHIYCEKKKYSLEENSAMVAKHFKFRKTPKTLMCSWTLIDEGEEMGTDKFRFNLDKLVNDEDERNEYEFKLNKLFYNQIYENSFTVKTDHIFNDEEQNILRIRDKFHRTDMWVFEMGWNYMQNYLNK